MSRPTSRLLSILELLQAHSRMAGSELARRLSVDPRTIRRDIVRLEGMGIPITAEQGRDGAYSLIAGFKLPPMMFTPEEVLALSMGLLAARGLALSGTTEAIAGARAKLERVMPTALKRRLRAIEETVTLGVERVGDPTNSAALETLTTAAQERTRVVLGYESKSSTSTPTAGAPNQRPFDPYGLVHRSGKWYVVGFCHLRKELRTFRLDRVQSVRLLEFHFERPERFDALKHVTESLARIPRAFSIQVLLRSDLQTTQRAIFPAFGLLEPVEEGVLLRGQAEDLRWFARELCRLPFPFEIRHPVGLRLAVAEHARSLLEAAQAGDEAPDG